MEPRTNQLISSSERRVAIGFPGNRNPSRGAALVTVLGFLVLITVVLVAFLASVTTEYSTASSAAAEASAKELAAASVQTVIGQIREATSQGVNVAWASQPGMIRTYGSGSPGSYAASSSPLANYKLYSSGVMVVPSTALGGFNPSDDVADNWASQPAVFTDLNAPVVGSDGAKNYPIMDPAAADVVSGYPEVEGFAINQTGPASTTNSPDNTAPMPVKWLYVLSDGTLTAPSSGTATTADFSSKKPTKDNPIVGRIAFWTDDETCKLNLNTAVGGMYWEDPMFTSDMDLAFSRYKPLPNEFNRYPGHPATTSLMPVFWRLNGLTSPQQYLFPSLANSDHSMLTDLAPSLDAASETAFKNLMLLSPRNAWGGSAMGTVPTAGVGANLTAVVPDSDRLYASADEALFGYADRTVTPANALSVSNDEMKKLRFFLTTSSRSPETNPFNQPKVGIWPVPENASKRSAADKLIAFCSTLKPSSSNDAYFFTRNNAQSATADWTTRNSQVFDYLDQAFQKPLPGFGGSIESRYTVAGGRRMIALIYDYIRSTINLLDTSFGFTGSGSAKQFNNTFMGVANNPKTYGFGQVVPIKIAKGGSTYGGAGRFPLIKEVAVMFMVRASNQPPLECTANGRPVVYDAAGNVISDSNGNIVPTYYPTVFGGNARAKLNPQHPWVAGTLSNTALASTYVPQLKDGGKPVMAVDTIAFTSNPNDPAAFFPIFGTWVTDAVTGGQVSSITDNPTPSSSGYTQYPSLYGTATKNGIWGVKAGAAGTVTISGTPYDYVAADFPASTSYNPAQTHAGMPYLTVQSPSTATGLAGAFVVSNPRYQAGVDGLPAAASLPPGSTQMQATFLVDPVNIANGVTPIHPKYQLTVTGLNAFQADSTPLGFVSPSTQSNALLSSKTTSYYNLGMHTISVGAGSYRPTRRKGGTDQYALNFISAPVTVSGSTFNFNGGTLKIEMFAPPVTQNDGTNSTNTTGSTLVQTYNIQFPDETFPTPLLPQMPDGTAGAQVANELLEEKDVRYMANSNQTGIQSDINHVPALIADLVPSPLLTSDAASALSKNPMTGVGSPFLCPQATSGKASYDSDTKEFTHSSAGTAGHSRFSYGAGNDTCTLQYFLSERNGKPWEDSRVKLNCDTIRAVECLYGDPRVFAGLPVVGTEFFKPHRFYSDLEMRGAHTFRGAIFNEYPDSTRNASSNFRGASDHYLNDAYLTDPSWNYNPWVANGPYASYIGRKQGNKIDQLGGSRTMSSQNGGLRSMAPYTTSSSEFNDTLFTAAWPGVTKFSEVWAQGGDFSNSVGSEPDGPYINKANEAGGLGATARSQNNWYPEWWPYTGTDGFMLDTQFSPNRLISSPVAFGSLPSGSTPTDAWRTLLFCANPNATSPTAYTARMANTDVTPANEVPDGSKAPDHLILDFYFMPVVEPYAISEPFSTAGKVNMNYQIVPFTYIKRDTALRGVFRSTMVTAVNDAFVPSQTGNESSFYKSNSVNPGYEFITFATAGDKYGQFLTNSGNWGFRYPIHAGETLKQFDARFQAGDIFRSPSEICSLFLYPAKQPTAASPLNPETPLVSWDTNSTNILNWWYANPGDTRKGLTGDNMRERPYASLYPRLTTKSNSYTVHFRVQALKKAPGTDPAQWVENKDQVLSEYRGSSLIERYIDPGDPNLPDFATNPTATLDDYYKYRVVSTKKFTVQ